MNAPYYQHQDNHLQISALERLSQETRTLIDNIIETSANADTLNAATETLVRLNTQLSALRCDESTPSPVAHFSFKAATNQPNEILPYSPVTGSFNPVAPPVSVNFDNSNQRLTATVTCSRAYEGPQNMVHGAVIAGIYDQILAMLATCIGKGGPTVSINTQFLQPTWLQKELQFTAWIERIEGRKVFVKGQCEIDGNIVSTADALCIEHRA